jgi:hypothetical protein
MLGFQARVARVRLRPIIEGKDQKQLREVPAIRVTDVAATARATQLQDALYLHPIG